MRRLFIFTLWLLASCGGLTLEEAEKFTKDSFNAQLAAQGLGLIELQPSKVEEGNSLVAISSSQPSSQPSGYTIVLSQGYGREQIEFVKDKEGKIYRLLRAPNIVETRTISSPICGPVGSGMIRPDVRLTYNNVAGEKRIAYAAKYVNIEYKQGCPQPP